MIYSFDYLKKGEIRLWINELPKSLMKSPIVICKNYDTFEQNETAIKQLALEITLHKHNSSYGLLGFEFVPSSENVVEVHYLDIITDDYKETIAYNKETVFIGLNKYYAESILKKSINFIASNVNIPSGKLLFNCAACCEVGSSEKLFSLMVEILITLFSKNKTDFEQQELVDIIQQLLIFR